MVAASDFIRGMGFGAIIALSGAIFGIMAYQEGERHGRHD